MSPADWPGFSARDESGLVHWLPWWFDDSRDLVRTIVSCNAVRQDLSKRMRDDLAPRCAYYECQRWPKQEAGDLEAVTCLACLALLSIDPGDDP
jgi:hypothetical protein